MPAPCSKCGATKTEPTRHGLRHAVARVLGYELRRCARCRRLRMLSKRAREREYAARSPAAADAAGESAGGDSRGIPYGRAGRSYDPDGFNGCPRCGTMKFSRTRRRWLERLARRPPMARCENCACRFPVPQA